MEKSDTTAKLMDPNKTREFYHPTLSAASRLPNKILGCIFGHVRSSTRLLNREFAVYQRICKSLSVEAQRALYTAFALRTRVETFVRALEKQLHVRRCAKKLALMPGFFLQCPRTASVDAPKGF